MAAHRRSQEAFSFSFLLVAPPDTYKYRLIWWGIKHYFQLHNFFTILGNRKNFQLCRIYEFPPFLLIFRYACVIIFTAINGLCFYYTISGQRKQEIFLISQYLHNRKRERFLFVKESWRFFISLDFLHALCYNCSPVHGFSYFYYIMCGRRNQATFSIS